MGGSVAQGIQTLNNNATQGGNAIQNNWTQGQNALKASTNNWTVKDWNPNDSSFASANVQGSKNVQYLDPMSYINIGSGGIQNGGSGASIGAMGTNLAQSNINPTLGNWASQAQDKYVQQTDPNNSQEGLANQAAAIQQQNSSTQATQQATQQAAQQAASATQQQSVQNTANNSFNQQNSLENSLLNARRYYGQQVYGGM